MGPAHNSMSNRICLIYRLIHQSPGFAILTRLGKEQNRLGVTWYVLWNRLGVTWYILWNRLGVTWYVLWDRLGVTWYVLLASQSEARALLFKWLLSSQLLT